MTNIRWTRRVVLGTNLFTNLVTSCIKGKSTTVTATVIDTVSDFGFTGIFNILAYGFKALDRGFVSRTVCSIACTRASFLFHITRYGSDTFHATIDVVGVETISITRALTKVFAGTFGAVLRFSTVDGRSASPGLIHVFQFRNGTQFMRAYFVEE